MKYNKLTVKAKYKKPDTDGRNKTFCDVVCDCGAKLTVREASLKQNNTQSCGCLKTSKTKLFARLYSIWKSMKARCNYLKHKNYKNYGGRGITICKEWQESFETFKTWALANNYKDNLELDRSNNNGNYEPSNCQFVTHKENCSNKNNNVIVWLNGLVLTAAEASRQLGHDKSYISKIIKRNGNNPYFPQLVLNPS